MQNHYFPLVIRFIPKARTFKSSRCTPGPDIINKGRRPQPTMDPLPYKISIQNQYSKQQHPEAAKTLVKSTLHHLNLPETQVFTPTAIKQQSGHAAWAVYSQTQQSTGRISDNTPIALAELTIIMHTDSKAALLLLAQRRPAKYTQIIT